MDDIRPPRWQPGEGHPNSRLTDDNAVTIRELYASGDWTHGQLASKFGVSKATIGLVTRGETWTHVGGPRIKGRIPSKSGERHPYAKLSYIDVLSIRHDATNGSSPEQLASDYEVSVQTIKRILDGRGWRPIT